MIKYDYSQPYVTRDEYLEVKGIDLNIELQDDDNASNKVSRFVQDLTNFVLDHLVMEYNCNELNRQSHNFEDLAEFRRVRFHYGMLEQIEYVLNNGLIQLDSGINRETGTITDFSSVVIGPSALKQFRLGGFCNKQESSTKGGSLSPREMPTLEELLLLVSRKVDKVDGKGLSANDFTTAYKLLLDTLSREINEKVDKVVGKVLSSNDFTNALKSKLEGIENYAQVNKIEEIRINNEPLSIIGKAVNLTAFAHDETKEDVANKVTTISSESTDAQYPTAKCVFDELQIVREIAEGKTKAFSVNPATTGNEGFQSGNATITVTSFVDVNGNEVDVSTLKKGDLVFTLNGENVKYADRWLVDPATGTWGLIDADTPNLEGYVTTDTEQMISGKKTFAVDKLVSSSVKSTGNNFYGKFSNGNIFLEATSNSFGIAGIKIYDRNNNGAMDLGDSSHFFKDLYLAGKLKDGTNEVAINELNFGLPKITKATWDNATTEERRALTRTGFWGEVEAGSYFISDARRLICFPADANNHCPCYFEGGTSERLAGFGFLTIEGAGGITLKKAIYYDSGPAKYTADFDRFKSKNLPSIPTNNASPQVLTIEANGGNIVWKDKADPEGTFNVINAADIVDNKLTEAQINIVLNGKPTLIAGTYKNYKDLLILGVFDYSSAAYLTTCFANETLSVWSINKTNGGFGKESDTFLRTNLSSIKTLNGKSVPAYPSSPANDKVLVYRGTGSANPQTMQWDDKGTTLYKHKLSFVYVNNTSDDIELNLIVVSTNANQMSISDIMNFFDNYSEYPFTAKFNDILNSKQGLVDHIDWNSTRNEALIYYNGGSIFVDVQGIDHAGGSISDTVSAIN